MAAQIAPSASGAPTAYHQEIHEFLESSFNDVAEQLANGVQAPTISFTKISTAKIEGIDVWKHYLQSATGAKLELTVNALANTVTVIPIEPMAANQVINASQSSAGPAAESPSTTTTLASPQTASADAADHKGSSKDKVPRPPNAFIIYRQEWHPKVVKEKPDLHNNSISVIIGRKWKAETEAVRNEYKRKAEDAKRQHAIDHPGYQYQPRKPSEKKKRMTKTKLAKLRAQANAAIAPDSMEDLNEMLANAANDKQVTVDTFQAPHRQGFPNLQPSQDVGGSLAFDVGGEDWLLGSQLAAWNADNQGPTSGQMPAVVVGQPLADGQETIDFPQHEVPYSFAVGSNIYDTTGPVTAAGASATGFHDATAEVERQESISDFAFNELFNYEAFAAPVVEGDDAESALQGFQSSYELDLEQSGSFHI
ncbi:hypothetical protein LTR37_016008 [Vermiconidia calcicola]|uniref:Uncharacterized protein n=1 Tax=Vermiconidia calcicola TaxID=1690605 RepID=A0ACC3MP70_9PEZI|nr:hypothetical protein LTR37_016008 [Vermiconidia calcicola]